MLIKCFDSAAPVRIDRPRRNLKVYVDSWRAAWRVAASSIECTLTKKILHSTRLCRITSTQIQTTIKSVETLAEKCFCRTTRFSVKAKWIWFWSEIYLIMKYLELLPSSEKQDESRKSSFSIVPCIFYPEYLRLFVVINILKEILFDLVAANIKTSICWSVCKSIHSLLIKKIVLTQQDFLARLMWNLWGSFSSSQLRWKVSCPRNVALNVWFHIGVAKENSTQYIRLKHKMKLKLSSMPSRAPTRADQMTVIGVTRIINHAY